MIDPSSNPYLIFALQFVREAAPLVRDYLRRRESESAKVLSMARRPEIEKDVLTRAEIAALQERYSKMSVSSIEDFYHVAHLRCKLEAGKAPKARHIQELVQLWKEMRKWKK